MPLHKREQNKKKIVVVKNHIRRMPGHEDSKPLPRMTPRKIVKKLFGKYKTKYKK